MSYQVTTLVVVFLLPSVHCAYLNAYRKEASRECAANQAVNYIKSEYGKQSTQKDRLWDIRCVAAPITGKENCHWSDYVNAYNDLDFMYQCPGGGYISGMISKYGSQDRKWKIKCCSITGVTLNYCYETRQGLLHKFQGAIEYEILSGKVLRGFGGTYDSGQLDREHRFEVCVMSKSD